MPSLRHHRPLARLAVAGVSVVAGLVTVAAPALADDVTGDVDGSEESTSTTPDPSETPEESPEQPTVEDSTPDGSTPEGTSSTPGSSGATAKVTPDAEVTDEADEAEAVEPNYGFQKFRVGVRIADGSTLPSDTITAGSVLRVTAFDEDGDPAPGFDIECTTVAVGDASRGESQCDPNDLDVEPELRRQAARGISIEPGVPVQERPNTLFLPPGWTAEVEMISAPNDLPIETEVATVEPCEADQVEGLPSCDGVTDVMFELGAPAEPQEPAEPADPDESTGAGSARLPDTGGTNQGLLFLGAGMVAAGGVAVAAGRRRTDDV